MSPGLFLATAVIGGVLTAIGHALGARAVTPAAQAQPTPPPVPADPFAGIPGLPGHPGLNALNKALHDATAQQAIAAGLGQLAQVLAPYITSPTPAPAAK